MAWLSSWTYRKEITVQAANVDAALSDFPCLVKVSNDADLAAALATGYDVRFTQSDGETLLKHETESWSGGGGSNVTAEWWVKVPSISSTTGATIYIYYGKAGASDGDDAANVWDANYKGVWHLGESAGSAADSTGNQNGTFEGDLPDQQTGKVGNCQNFDGSGDAVNLGSGTYQYANGFTMECLFKGGSGSTYEAFLCAGNTRSFFGRNAGNLIYLHYAPTSSLVTGSAVNDNAWHHCLVTKSASTGVRLYLDGAYDTGNASYTGTVNYSTYTGVDTALGIDEDGDQWSLNGYLDEFRISDVVRSDAWIKFTKANIFEADNELTWGSEEGAVVLDDDSFENASPFENDEEIGTAEATGGSTPYSYAITSQTQTAGNEVLEVTGPLSPDATGTYVENGTYNDEPAYEREGGAYWIWQDYPDLDFFISAAKGTSDNSWKRLGAGGVNGEYTAQGTATGTATVAGIEPFAIGSASGVITIDDNTGLAVGQEWEVVVEVTDDESLTDTGTFTIGLVASAVEISATQTLLTFGQIANVGVGAQVQGVQTLPTFSQVASVQVVSSAELSGSQTLASFGQNAQLDAVVSVEASQTLPAFGQVSTVSVLASISSTQTLPTFGQVGILGVSATLEASQELQPFGQAGTVEVSPTLEGIQTLSSFGQSGTLSAELGFVAVQTLATFGQSASLSNVVISDASQTLSTFGQVGALSSVDQIVGTQTLQTFGQGGSVVSGAGFVAAQTLSTFGQVGSLAVDVSLEGVQTLPTFGQSAAFGGVASLESLQTLTTFGQSGTFISGQGLRGVQTLSTFGQVGTLAATTELICVQSLASFGQAGSLTTQLSVTGIQSLPSFGQAGVLSVTIESSAIQTLPSFGQSGTLLATISSDIVGVQTLPKFGQSASLSVPDTLAGKQTLPAFGQAGTIGTAIVASGIQTLPTFGQSGVLELRLRQISATQTLPRFGQVGTIEVVALAVPRIIFMVGDSLTPVFSTGYVSNESLSYPGTSVETLISMKD